MVMIVCLIRKYATLSELVNHLKTMRVHCEIARKILVDINVKGSTDILYFDPF